MLLEISVQRPQGEDQNHFLHCLVRTLKKQQLILEDLGLVILEIHFLGGKKKISDKMEKLIIIN